MAAAKKRNSSHLSWHTPRGINSIMRRGQRQRPEQMPGQSPREKARGRTRADDAPAHVLRARRRTGRRAQWSGRAAPIPPAPFPPGNGGEIHSNANDRNKCRVKVSAVGALRAPRCIRAAIPPPLLCAARPLRKARAKCARSSALLRGREAERLSLGGALHSGAEPGRLSRRSALPPVGRSSGVRGRRRDM